MDHTQLFWGAEAVKCHSAKNAAGGEPADGETEARGEARHQRKVLRSLCIPQLLGWAVGTHDAKISPNGGHRVLQGSGGSFSHSQQKGNSSGVTEVQEPGSV